MAVCDVRNERREAIKTMVDQKYGNHDCAMYADQQELWARKDIDALLIATGDRWHTLLSVMSAKAGKDVYCEKPCSMTIADSRALADTFLQSGPDLPGGDAAAQRAEFHQGVRSGAQRQTRQAEDAPRGSGAGRPLGAGHDSRLAARTSPSLPSRCAIGTAGWDPAPWRPYHSQYVAGRWRGYFDFHGGGILEWGSHTVDLCQWAAGTDDTTPVEFVPEGMGRNTPYAIHCRYANGLQLEMRDSGFMGLGSCHIRYEGDAGWVETADGGKIEVSANLRGEDLSGRRGRRHHQPRAQFRGLREVAQAAARQCAGGGADAYRLPRGLHRIPVGPQADL